MEIADEGVTVNTDFILPGEKNKLDLLWDSGTPGTDPANDTVFIDSLSTYEAVLIECYDKSEMTPLPTATFTLARVGCGAVAFKVGRGSGAVYKLPIYVHTGHIFLTNLTGLTDTITTVQTKFMGFVAYKNLRRNHKKEKELCKMMKQRILPSPPPRIMIG